MERNINILIVEDEVLYAMLLKKKLSRAGFRVCDMVTTGEEALAAREREQPDLILMDIRLAGPLDGIETAERMMEKEKVKIIFMTGYALDEIKKRTMKLSPLAFLEKPISVEKLLEHIAPGH